MLVEEKRPYEFLVRWQDGVVKGAHVGYVHRILRDGVVVSETPGDVTPVTVGIQVGFPLADILDQIQIGALLALEEARVEKVALETTLAARQSEYENLQSAVMKLLSEYETYKVQHPA